MSRDAMILAPQRGFSLVAAMFLLVVLAALGAFAARIGTMQHQTAATALRAEQALEAARTGVEWAGRRAIDDGWCGTSTLNLTESGAAGFSVNVQCTQSTQTVGAKSINVYVIDVLAEAGAYGGPDYVSRRLQVKLTDGA